MSQKFSMDDYIDVAERIVEFNKKYPDGSLQTISWEVSPVGEHTFIVYRAAAYRTPTDRRPGHGIAWEPFPGQTPYTRNSELMNAETAAWGRAIVALGITSNRKLASRQEVQARKAEQDAPKPAPKLDPDIIRVLKEKYKLSGWDGPRLQLHLTAVGVEDASNLTRAMNGLTAAQAEELDVALNEAIKAREKAAAK